MRLSNRQTVTRWMGISRLTGCEQVENKSWRWVSNVWVSVVGSKMSSGFNMTGFYGGMGWRLGSGFKVQDERFWEVPEVVDNLGQVKLVDSLGNWGGWGGWTTLHWCR